MGMPTATKKKGKSKSQGGKIDTDKAKPIKHNAETFQLFDKLKLDAPITTADIPGLMEKLDKQMTEYQAKVKEWEENKEELKRKIREGIVDEEEEPAKEGDTTEEKAAEEETPE